MDNFEKIEDNEINRKVLFIGGHRKSGTTMLTRLFDGHRQIDVSPIDLNVLYAYYPEWSGGQYSKEERLARFKKVVLNEFKAASFDQSKDISFDYTSFETAVLQAWNELNSTDMVAIIRAIAAAHRVASSTKKDWLVLKETSAEIYSSSILSENPDWKFLHLARDPRDNFAAIKAGLKQYYAKMGNDYIDTLGSLVTRYAYGVKWLKWNIKQYGLERYYLLRFEDLLTDPTLEMKNLAAWLTVDWNENLTIPTYGSQIYQGNSHDGIKFKGLDSQNVGKWQQRIDYDEAAIIEFLLKDEMDFLGYHRETDQAKGAQKASHFYARMNYKYFFADRFK